MASGGILSIAQAVIRKGAEIGLDEAGTRIAGSAWPYIKKVMAPVVEELERRYPKLFLVGDREASASAEKAANELSQDLQLQKIVDDGLASLKQGQEEILRLLSKYDGTLQDIGQRVDRGFEEAERKNGDANALVLAELRAMRAEIHTAQSQATVLPPTVSLADIDRRGNGYQYDAIKWISAGDAESASERLNEGRDLLLSGLKRAPQSARLLASLGFIEKTQAQAEFLRGDQSAAVAALAQAGKYFTKALQQDPNEISALNGMANVFYYAGDFDRAISLGKLVFEKEPEYGAGALDLSLSLEGKFNESGPSPALLSQMTALYSHLEKLMPKDPISFPASYLAHVQQRLAYLKSLPAASSN